MLQRILVPVLLAFGALALGLLVSGCGGSDTVAMRDAIVYRSISNGHDAVFLMNADGTGKRLVIDSTSNGQNKLQGSLSPDGTRVLFIDGNQAVRVYNLLTNTIATLYYGVDVYTANFSPDGRKIAFSDYAPGTSNQAIYVMNADGSDVTMIQDGSSGDVTLPVWSPDGRKIAFQTDWNGKISIMNADGTGVVALDNAGGSRHPSFLPNGKLLYASEDGAGSTRDILMINTDGSGKVNLTNTPTINESFPTANAAGTQIAFSDGSNIFVADFDGSTLGVPVDITAEIGNACWRPSFGRLSQQVPEVGNI
ncbi:MAG: TolB family protein [Armatimonadota bacterium]